MRKLLIVDPTLESHEGHSYNYDSAIFSAARSKFDAVELYGDVGFRDAGPGALPCQPVLNRLPFNAAKRWAHTALHLMGREIPESVPFTPQNSSFSGAWGTTVRLAKYLRARDLDRMVRSIIAGHPGSHELHVLFQHTRVDELLVADSLRRRPPEGTIHVHLVLRHVPELYDARIFGKRGLASTLRDLAVSSQPRFHLLTDSERLSDSYRSLGIVKVDTLPVPIVLPEEEFVPVHPTRMDVSFLGAPRVEKGFCELPSLVARLPRTIGGRTIRAAIQVTRVCRDPRVRATVAELRRLKDSLPSGHLELLESPAPLSVYYEWVRTSGVIALPYISEKYNASTSGVFIEAISLGVPVLAPANSWMSDVISETERKHHLRIGETFTGLDELPDLVARMAERIAEYRISVQRFSRTWRQIHSPVACVDAIIAAAA